MAESAAQATYELRWREAGSGRSVILLHAFPVDGRLFGGQLSAAEVGRIGARLMLVDMPGFGQTPLPEPAPDVMTVEDLAESVAALIRREDLHSPVVGGVAIGGYTAVELAARHPELVGGLILMGIKPAPDSPQMAPHREAVARAALQHGAQASAEELHAQPLGSQADDAVRAKMREMISSADPRAIAALVRGIARRPDPAPALSRIGVPALVIAGESDPFSPLEDVRNAARMLPNAEFVIIKGVGHMAPVEAPLAVTRAIAAFVRNLPSGLA